MQNFRQKYSFLSELNEQQYEAAVTTEGPLLILAGAGSGKTKTIVARTAFIIAEKKALPNQILVLTFTNKAAKEMQERGLRLLASIGEQITMKPFFSTFHSWGVKFLRQMNAHELFKYGLKDNFIIADEHDQVVILKKLFSKYFSKEELKDFGVKINNFLLPLGSIQNNFVSYINEEEAFEEIMSMYTKKPTLFQNSIMFTQSEADYIIRKIASIYVDYKAVLRENNFVDFEDLINLPISILDSNEHIRKMFQQQYRYIMVDEFQDTNGSQLKLLNLLLNEDENICVVGDDAQSIYGWRGAQIEYILNFHKFYKEVKKVNLKINYRSTQSIVHTANKLLDNAGQKHDFKEKLEAFEKKQGLVRAVFLDTAEEEATKVVNTIKVLLKKGAKPEEITILYRSNYINRFIELELIKNGVAYKIYKGRTLLERKIVQQLITYLKLIYSKEEASIPFARILQTIVSDKTFEKLEQRANELGISLMQFILSQEFENPEHKDLRILKKIKERLSDFAEELSNFKAIVSQEDYDYFEFAESFFKHNILLEDSRNTLLKYSKGVKISDQKLKEASSNIKLAEILHDLMLRFKSLEDFLENITLEGEQDEQEQGKVNLMTVHASKGLEFDFVFVIGASQGIFPSNKSLEYDYLLEEERRLAYVAFTRAKKALFISGAAKYIGDQCMAPSQFITEAGLEIIFE